MYPIKKAAPEDFASVGGPTILSIFLQRRKASLNPFKIFNCKLSLCHNVFIYIPENVEVKSFLKISPLQSGRAFNGLRKSRGLLYKVVCVYSKLEQEWVF